MGSSPVSRNETGAVDHARLGPFARGIDRSRLAVDHVAVERVLHVRRSATRFRSVETLHVRLVVREERFPARGHDQPPRPQPIEEGKVGQGVRAGVVREQDVACRARLLEHDRRLGQRSWSPHPGVPEPQVWEELDRRRLRPAVVDGDADGHVLGRHLGVFDEDVEVAVVVEDAGVEELELRAAAAAPLVLLDEALVRVLPLRVLVEPLHVGMARGGVEVEVVLLDVLSVVPFGRHQAEETLLQDGIALVPEGQGEAEDLVAVANGGQAVLAPAVGAGARVVMGEVGPGIPALAVVLAHGAPRPLRRVGAPTPPSGERAVLAGHAVLFAVGLWMIHRRRTLSH